VKTYLGGSAQAKQSVLDSATVKFRSAYDKAAAKAQASGGTCPGSLDTDTILAEAAESVGIHIGQASSGRYRDNGDGTFTDQSTALRWEQKDGSDGVGNPADPHDADNAYTWSFYLGADGTAFTDFLAKLNGGSGSCFQGSCDWRLPTIQEMNDVLLG